MIKESFNIICFLKFDFRNNCFFFKFNSISGIKKYNDNIFK